MYNHLKDLLQVAEEIGKINEISMGDWIPGVKRTQIKGSTQSGKTFELTLEVYECKSE